MRNLGPLLHEPRIPFLHALPQLRGRFYGPHDLHCFIEIDPLVPRPIADFKLCTLGSSGVSYQTSDITVRSLMNRATKFV